MYKLGGWASSLSFDRKDCGVCSNVIYKFSCVCDKTLFYIGQTSPILSIRIKEHLRLDSAIGKHVLICKLCKDNFYDNFSVIEHEEDNFKLKIKESIAIKILNPPLNSDHICKFNSVDTFIF